MCSPDIRELFRADNGSVSGDGYGSGSGYGHGSGYGDGS